MRSFFVLLLCAMSLFAAGEQSGRRAPGFSLPDSSGKQYDLAEYRGKLVIIDFMQVACPHCKAFSAILESAKVKYGEKLVVLSIVNPPSDQKNVAQYIAENKTKSPILFDCGQAAYSYLRPSGSSIAIPHVFLVDGEGMIRNDFSYSDKTKSIFEGKGIYAEIDRLLAAKK
ncbi:MAG: TlpA disulfide reductase family protein [Bryobacteraceae bacterium]